jgi:bifunctional enzyme CysN/CysC
MAHASDLIANNIEEYLDRQLHKDRLRFITCGSVDDGKSTLIGRMLYESHLVFEDHLRAVEKDSKTVGTQGGDLDLALLLDGLQAEREQGITIDVAYRYFSTDRRSFIVADTPGHEEYTRNMATGASTADLAVILVDARKGVLTQTRRHSYLAHLLGIRQIVVAINKMDLVDFDQTVFDSIAAEYSTFASRLGFASNQVTAIPLSALRGDNVVTPSPAMAWYTGPTLFEHLETVSVHSDIDLRDDPAPQTSGFRMAIQWANRPHLDFRGVSGQITAGAVRPGDEVWIAPRGGRAIVERIVTFDGDLETAVVGQSVTLTFDRELDASRGDVVSSIERQVAAGDHLATQLVWMHEQPMQPGRPYLIKLGTKVIGGVFAVPEHRVDVNTLEHLPAEVVAMNEVARVSLRLDRVSAFDPYSTHRELGGFIVIDRLTNTTVGAGMIDGHGERRAEVSWHAAEVDRIARASLNDHQPAIVWLTGMSGAGKSTIASLVEQRLHGLGVRTFVLDGDNLRHGLNADLGFSAEDRSENVRRAGEVAVLMADAGLVVISALISPFADDRDAVRAKANDGEFFEVYIDASIDVLRERDPKGLYARAQAGQVAGLTGVDPTAPYQAPLTPELRIDTADTSAVDAADQIVATLRSASVIH